MKLLPQRKTLVGYARKIVKAHSKVQIEILQQSYRERLTQEEIEVLDHLSGYKLLQHETASQLVQLQAEALGPLPPLRRNLDAFVRRGLQAQHDVDEIIAQHRRTGR